jgi:hypothetical protein
MKTGKLSKKISGQGVKNEKTRLFLPTMSQLLTGEGKEKDLIIIFLNKRHKICIKK